MPSFEAMKRLLTQGLVKLRLVNTSGNEINPATEDTLSTINGKIVTVNTDSVKSTLTSTSYTAWSGLPVIDTALINPATTAVSGESVGSGDGSTTSFSHTAAFVPVEPKSVSIAYTIGGTAYTGTDDGEGNITGTDLSGTINYNTGTVSLTFSTAPDSGTSITMNYSYYENGNGEDVSNAKNGYVHITISGITTSKVHIVPVVDGVEMKDDELIYQADTDEIVPVEYSGGTLAFKAWRDTGTEYITLSIEGVKRE